ncbi:MAG: hypothetical protein SPI53_04510 [Erysipelotrichaceae bacterium]|nr:hypothetical protein [Erysipelotrichaceae bacterium]
MSDKNVLNDHKGTYIRIDPLYSVDNLILALENYDFIYSSICDYKGYLIKLLRYEEKRKRPDKRYGYLMKVLLPKGRLSDDKFKLISITKKLVEGIRGCEKLEYMSYVYQIGCNVKYLVIYISDREYHRYYKEYYKRDYYQDINTRKMCNSNVTNKILVAKKGSLKKVIKDNFVSSKSTIFKGTKENFLKTVEGLKKLYFQIIDSFNLIFKSNYIFKHKRYSPNNNRFQKRIFQKINSLMIRLENKLYKGINLSTKYLDEYDTYKQNLPPGETCTTLHYEKLVKLFYKFNNRFNKMSFHVEGILFHLETRADLAEANLSILEAEFEDEYQQILEGII